jgi:hypothetical protein
MIERKTTAEEQVEFKKREEQIEEFLAKVQELGDEYRDAVGAMSITVLTLLDEGQARTYGGWSVPPHLPNIAYKEISALLSSEHGDLMESISQLSGDCDGGGRKHYDA